MNHKRTVQIHLAHIEWICCIQECFLRDSISHYKWINFLFNFFPTLMNFISVNTLLANGPVLSWNTDGHVLDHGLVIQAMGIETLGSDSDADLPRDFHQFALIAYFRPNSLVNPLKVNNDQVVSLKHQFFWSKT